jgi:hypothetical protein
VKPRDYAFAYISAKSKDAQKAALAGCPVEWQELVRAHITIAKTKMRLRGDHVRPNNPQN